MEYIIGMELGKKNISQVNLGQVARFVDRNYAASGAVKPILSSMPIYARLLRNESNGNLTAGTIVTASTDAVYGPGKAAGAAAVAGTTVGHCVVDPFVSGNIADEETFWGIFYGPCKFKFTTGTATTLGMVLALGAAGRVQQLDHTSLTDQLIFDRCGRALEVVASGAANDTLFRGFADFRF